MKQILLLAALAYSWQSFAHVEYRAGDEEQPSAARRNLATQCFSEAVSSGCHSPAENRREFRSCVRDQMASFSSGCRAFMETKYGKGE